MFAQRGYHGATLESVAQAAGLSKGALFHYFPSKEELFLALLEDRLGAGITDSRAIIAERGSDSEDLAAATETFLRRVNLDPRWLPLLLEFLAHGSRDPAARAGVIEHFLAPARQAVANMVRGAVGPDIDRALLTADELGLALAALINGLAIERAFDPDAVPNDLLDRLFQVLQAGLMAAGAAAPAKPKQKSTSRKGGTDV